MTAALHKGYYFIMRRLMILTASKIFTTHLYIHGASHFVSVGVLFFNMNISFGND